MNDESNALPVIPSIVLSTAHYEQMKQQIESLTREKEELIAECDAARNMYPELCALRTHISTLRKRLEIDRMTVYDIEGGEVVGQREVECEDDDFDTDGIACRDATIALLDDNKKNMVIAMNELSKQSVGIVDENARLRAELDAAKVDVERYRWLRNESIHHDEVGAATHHICGDTSFYWLEGDDLDGAIDTARSRGETGEKIG